MAASKRDPEQKDSPSMPAAEEGGTDAATGKQNL
jgi:hypothetical protein